MGATLLVANRGEIARRVTRTARAMGMRTVAVFSEADRGAPHAVEADEAYFIGPAAPKDSYLRIDALLAVARECGADLVHPGYGFLAENSDFARAVQAAGRTWVGPAPSVIDAMGDKINARNQMSDAGVPVARGTRSPVRSAQEAVAGAHDIGYPIMVKAAAGGGGIGMQVVTEEAMLRESFASAQSSAERFFGNGDVLLERYVEGARHVEVQILGLADGRVVALGDRDCSVQRRHQKVVEESPSPGVGAELRDRMLASAVLAGETVGYQNAGTIEFLVDPHAQEFMFLEMNTRLQVEHPITELVTGLDLVEQQLRIAMGEPVGFDPSAVPAPTGHAIELRVYAEDPQRFIPSPGTLTRWSVPQGPGIRVDSGYECGSTVSQYYDPLLAKLCAHGASRAEALSRAHAAAAEFVIEGTKSNLPFLLEVLASDAFRTGRYDTTIVDQLQA